MAQGVVAGLSPRRPSFNPRLIHVGFVMDKTAPGFRNPITELRSCGIGIHQLLFFCKKKKIPSSCAYDILQWIVFLQAQSFCLWKVEWWNCLSSLSGLCPVRNLVRITCKVVYPLSPLKSVANPIPVTLADWQIGRSPVRNLPASWHFSAASTHHCRRPSLV